MKRLVYIIILLILAACFTSCRTQYIPVESVRTEYKTRDSIRIDSIYQRDSIYTLVKGDTVYQYRYEYLYRYLTTNRTDTILKNDSIRVPYPVEKKLNRWQSLKMELGGWAFVLVIACVIFICGLYLGGDIYERMLSVSDVSEQKLYERLNQFNLANYTSLSRIKDMSGNVLWTTMCVLAMIVFVVGVLCVYIKKVDLLKKS